MRSYPTKGRWKLDEVDGVLHYRGTPIGAVADLTRLGRADEDRPHYHSHEHLRTFRDLLWQEGVPNPHLSWIYKCAICHGWAIGNGSTWCSDECRKADRAQAARERRAKTRVTAETCAVCGGALDTKRASRRYCSNRCRQAAYRKQRAAQGGNGSMTEIEDELFLMTNLYPRSTGLPMVVWVGPRYGVPHDVRIKVMQSHGERMDPHNLAVVALRPTPCVVAGHLSGEDLDKVKQWIELNAAAIIDHWNGLTDGVGLGPQLRRLP